MTNTYGFNGTVWHYVFVFFTQHRDFQKHLENKNEAVSHACWQKPSTTRQQFTKSALRCEFIKDINGNTSCAIVESQRDILMLGHGRLDLIVTADASDCLKIGSLFDLYIKHVLVMSHHVKIFCNLC